MSSSVFDSSTMWMRVFHPLDDERPPPPGANDLMVPVADNVRLHVRVHHAEHAHVAVLLFHGNGELVADYDAFAHHYTRAGAMLAVADYRGYGRSEGWPSMRTLIEDPIRLVQAIRGELAGLPLVAMGRSLGSACAAELARAEPAVLQGLMLESGFANLEAFVRRRGIALPGPLPEDDYAVYCPLRKLRRWTGPLLVLHGEQDTLIAPEEGAALHAAASSVEKRLALIPGHGHNDVLQASMYWREVVNFLGRWRS